MDVKQLHITNGDTVVTSLEDSSIQGDALPWRDPMHHGPFPADLDLDAVCDIRAEYFAGAGKFIDSVKHEFDLRNNRLRTASQYDEVVLWFEHDLLDQLQILQLLDWFSDAEMGTTALTMICIDTFPELPGFRGLGQLSGSQLETLAPQREPVTSAQLQLAKTAWKCFRSENPNDLQKLIRSDTSALPFLSKAIQRHLQEYAWTSDGLTRTERQILKLVSTGVVNPEQVFVQNMDLENALYIGDWLTYRIIARLCNLNTPLLSCTPHESFRYPPEHDLTQDLFQQQALSLTDAGREVLAGKRNASALINRNEWLGGVHINSDEPIWMWDNAASRLTLVIQ